DCDQTCAAAREIVSETRVCALADKNSSIAINVVITSPRTCKPWTARADPNRHGQQRELERPTARLARTKHWINRGIIEFRNAAQAARFARRVDPPLSARLPLLFEPARARCERG